MSEFHRVMILGWLGGMVTIIVIFGIPQTLFKVVSIVIASFVAFWVASVITKLFENRKVTE